MYKGQYTYKKYISGSIIKVYNTYYFMFFSLPKYGNIVIINTLLNIRRY